MALAASVRGQEGLGPPSSKKQRDRHLCCRLPLTISILAVKQTNGTEARRLIEGLEEALGLSAFRVENGWRFDFDESEDPEELIEVMEADLNLLSDTWPIQFEA